MLQLSVSPEAHTLEMMARAGANNLCLFLYSSRTHAAGVHFLCHYGMPERVKDRYSKSLWHHDPFLKTACNGQIDTPQCVFERRQLEEKASSDYWSYIDRVGYRDIVAAIHQFDTGLYLVGGLMCMGNSKPSGQLATSEVVESLTTLTQRTAKELVTSLLLPVFSDQRRPATPEESCSMALTPREHQVVEALQAGYSNKQIAASLGLSEYTVENHFKRLFKKFSVHNRTALLCEVQRLSLI